MIYVTHIDHCMSSHGRPAGRPYPETETLNPDSWFPYVPLL